MGLTKMEETKSRAYSCGTQSGELESSAGMGSLGERVPHLAIVNLDRGHREMLKVNHRGPNNHQELRRFKPLTGDCDQSGSGSSLECERGNGGNRGDWGGSWQVENVKSAH